MVYTVYNKASLNFSCSENKHETESAKEGNHSKTVVKQAPKFYPTETVVSPRAPVNVFLFAYMRGGSSLLGEVFNQNPDVFYWYEPLTQFYSHVFGVAPTTRYTPLLYNDGKESNPLRL